TEKRVVGQSRAWSCCHWLQTRGRFPSVGENKTFTLGDATQNTLRMFSELKHGHGPHNIEFKFKLKLMIWQGGPDYVRLEFFSSRQANQIVLRCVNHAVQISPRHLAQLPLQQYSDEKSRTAG